jgi:hypothetical protein
VDKPLTIHDVQIDDVVRTPSGREAKVVGYKAGRLDLEYQDCIGMRTNGANEVLLLPSAVTMLQRQVPM